MITSTKSTKENYLQLRGGGEARRLVGVVRAGDRPRLARRRRGARRRVGRRGELSLDLKGPAITRTAVAEERMGARGQQSVLDTGGLKACRRISSGAAQASRCRRQEGIASVGALEEGMMTGERSRRISEHAAGEILFVGTGFRSRKRGGDDGRTGGGCFWGRSSGKQGFFSFGIF
ncbi:uncharacterized protein A4U43_C08F17780 [Asparagus officinalis]|nr:uncharacterized protein A4U43_C08F17780 [Asparagus officinalis]